MNWQMYSKQKNLQQLYCRTGSNGEYQFSSSLATGPYRRPREVHSRRLGWKSDQVNNIRLTTSSDPGNNILWSSQIFMATKVPVQIGCQNRAPLPEAFCSAIWRPFFRSWISSTLATEDTITPCMTPYSMAAGTAIVISWCSLRGFMVAHNASKAEPSSSNSYAWHAPHDSPGFRLCQVIHSHR